VAMVLARRRREQLARRQELVLVVEDNPMTRRALIKGLEMLNYRALEAAQGEEALPVVERHRDEIALVLADLVMPEMGGIELATRLHEVDPTVRVVVLSGHPLQEKVDELRPAGVVGTMQKPATLGRLADAISRALGRPADNPRGLEGGDCLDLANAAISGRSARR